MELMTEFKVTKKHVKEYEEARFKIRYVCEQMDVAMDDYADWRNEKLRDWVQRVEAKMWLEGTGSVVMGSSDVKDQGDKLRGRR